MSKTQQQTSSISCAVVWLKKPRRKGPSPRDFLAALKSVKQKAFGLFVFDAGYEE
jgi:hypothetical protein